MTTRAVLACVVTLAACGEAVPTRTTAQSVRVSNGSFESGDFGGWTLLESSGVPTAGTLGIATGGQVISGGDSVFDQGDKMFVDQMSPGLPITYDATEGVRVGFFLQNAAETQRMYQRVTLPTCGSFLRWDMAYQTHAAFDLAAQFIAVNLRDVTDTVVATPFKTNAASATSVPAMSPFEQDLSAFDGQTLVLDFQTVAMTDRIDVALDHIRIECDNPPIASPLPSSLGFASQLVGTPSGPQSVDITNTGTTALTITALNVTGVPSFGITSSTLPITVAPNASTSIVVTFTPVIPYENKADLVIVSNDQDSPTSVGLVGQGLGPEVSLDLPTIVFGGQRVGTTSPTQVITITNTGNVDLTINSASTTAPFAVTQPTALTLMPFEAAQIDVTFAPTAAGPAQQDLVISSNVAGGSSTFPLSGLGTIGTLQITPGTLVLGDVRLGLPSSPLPLAVRNLGDAPVTISGISGISGITVSGLTFPVSVLPGAELTFLVAIAPSTAGPITGALSIESPTGDTPVPVAGNALAAALVADPPVLDLGSSVTGEATNAVTVTLTNITSAPVAIETIDIGNGQFVIDPAPPTTPILPGESIEFGVRFFPDGEGDAASMLSVRLQGTTDADVTIAVSGEGIAEAGGCCSANGSSSFSWLALATLLTMRRRRRRIVK